MIKLFQGFFIRGLAGALLLCVVAFYAHAQKDSCGIEKPAMELGGLVTVDYAAPIDSMRNGQLQIGTVQMGAIVNICDEVNAAITIMAENRLDQLWIDQAMASYKPKRTPRLEALFGQFTFNHGILSTRLISDPLINDDVEFINPGVAFNYSLDAYTLGLGATIIHTDQDTVMGVRASNDAAFIINADFHPNEESLVRISSLMDSASVDADAGVSLAYNQFIFDGEVYGSFTAWKSSQVFGYFTGLKYGFNDLFALAARFEGRAEAGVTDGPDYRLAGGGDISIGHGVFVAAEVAHVMPAGSASYQEVAFQIGLESTLKLPGFQRRTLANDN